MEVEQYPNTDYSGLLYGICEEDSVEGLLKDGGQSLSDPGVFAISSEYQYHMTRIEDTEFTGKIGDIFEFKLDMGKGIFEIFHAQKGLLCVKEGL